MISQQGAWNILHIEDDADDHILVESMLNEAQGRSIKVDWAETFAQGRQMLSETVYDAVLVDYDLEGQSGIELIREFGGGGYAAPMILLTGLGSYEADVEAILAGATLFLTKNEINPLLLERSIRYAIDRKRTEEQLRFSEEKFLTIFQRSPTPTFLLSLPEGRFMDANRAYLDLVGYEKDELMGKTTLELGIVRDEAGRKANYDSLEAKGYARMVDVINFTKAGEERILMANLERIEIEGCAYVMGTSVDVTERKRAEEELRRSEERFARTFHSNPAGLTITQAEDGRYLDVNESFCKITGYSRAELIGRTTVEIGFFDNPAEREAIIRDLRSGRGIQNFEIAIPDRAGETHQILLSLESIEIEGQDCLLSTCIDVTRRKQAEEELRLLAEALEVERAKLAAAIEYLPVGVGIGDLDGRTLSLNPEGLKLHGFTSEEDMLARLDQYLDEFELRYMNGRLMPLDEWPASRAMRGEYVQDYELRLCHKQSGSERILSYSAAPVRNREGETVRIVYVIQDMTGRTAVQEALQASETRFRQLADSMPQLVWMAQADGTVEYYNYRYREFDGIGPSEGGGWTWSPVLHPEDAERTLEAWQHSVATGETYEVEHRIRMADGSYRWHLSRGIPAYDRQGKLAKWYGTATDVHELQQTRADLAEYAARLKRSNDELENFALVASHDLQEPLRKIQMFGERLGRHLTGQLSEAAEDDLERMQQAAARMKVMIDGLLRLARVDRSGHTFVMVDLSTVAAEVVSDLEGRMRASQGQVVVGELPRVMGDGLQLRQLLLNLIGNGLKFQREGTPPVVRVAGEAVTAGDKQMVRITVADNGTGFDEAHAERLFQPFVRLHRRAQFEGSGIGLAICRKIVERHGGWIEARSTPGEGSVFTVVLPAAH
jgi:PAS domain S-box-containing protein